MTNVNDIMKKLLFISDQICEIYDILFDLSMTNQEQSPKYENMIEFFENYLSQETTILDSLTYHELIAIMKNLFEIEQHDDALERCYESVKYYFLDKYPYEKNTIEKIEFADAEDIDDILNNDSEEMDKNFEEYEDPSYFELEYEDESDVAEYINYVNLRNKITVIKKMYQHIKNTQADNKIDYRYKKDLLKQFKGFKYDFFSLNRDTELLGIKYHFDVDKIPDLPELHDNFSSIYYNECLDILDDLYLTPSNEREVYTILETLFNMLCFDEYIKKLSNEQIDRLITVCYQLEQSISKSYFGEIGLQKLVKIKKN